MANTASLPRTAPPASGEVARADVSTKARVARSRNRMNPTLFDAIAVDPTLRMPRSVVDELVADMHNKYRRGLMPTMRVGAIVGMRAIAAVKRILPFQVASEPLLNVAGILFTRYLVDPKAKRFLLRHMCVETALCNFIARNSGGEDVREADLFPTRAEHMGDWNGQNAVVLHDANLFNLIIDLGLSKTARVDRRVPLEEIDFSPLDIPESQVRDDEWQIMRLDLQSALYLVVFTLSILLDEHTSERALNSFQFDESLMTAIANITGNDIFRTWTPVRFTTWLGSPTYDPGRDLHWHIIVCEYAYHELCRMRDEVAASRAPR